MRLMSCVLVLIGSVLSACTSYPLPKVGYDGPVGVTSSRVGTLSVTSGVTQGSSATTMVPAGGTFVSVGGGNSPNWVNFNQEDQAIFATSLRDELNRLGILNMMPTSTTSHDVGLRLMFIRTVRNPNNDYLLNVGLEIQTPKETTTKKYEVRSFEGETGWAKFNVTPVTGKKMAAQKLLNLMIPDIEAAIRTL